MVASKNKEIINLITEALTKIPKYQPDSRSALEIQLYRVEEKLDVLIAIERLKAYRELENEKEGLNE